MFTLGVNIMMIRPFLSVESSHASGLPKLSSSGNETVSNSCASAIMSASILPASVLALSSSTIVLGPTYTTRAVITGEAGVVQVL